MKKIENIKLEKNEKDSIFSAASVLKSQMPVSKVILFGSKARNQPDRYSDIDLLVLTSCPVTTSLRHSVSEKISDINIQNDVVLSCLVASEQDWNDGLIRYMPIYEEIQKDGCEI
jgi:predicted nucleotidyltransferase